MAISDFIRLLVLNSLCLLVISSLSQMTPLTKMEEHNSVETCRNYQELRDFILTPTKIAKACSICHSFQIIKIVALPPIVLNLRTQSCR